MEIPPIEGVSLLCTLRSPGISTIFFLREYLIITGMIMKQMIREVIADARIEIITCGSVKIEINAGVR
jgi:hypothetical protein